MIIKHQGPGVVPEPFKVKSLDGLPSVGDVLSNASYPDDIRLEVVAIDWAYNWGFFTGCKLEAIVTVKPLPTQQELWEQANL